MIALWGNKFLPWLGWCNGDRAALSRARSTYKMSLIMIAVRYVQNGEGSQGLSDIVQQHACSTKSLKPKGKGPPGKGKVRGREMEGNESV